VYCEFLNEANEPARPGEPCRLLVTDLANTLMPFIRYDQGDWMELGPETSLLGSGWRTLHHIKGRDEDFATLPDGSRLSFNSFYEVVYGYDRIDQFRVVQRRRDSFEIVIAASTEYVDSIREAMLHRLQERFPPEITFQIRRVDRIEPDASGKLRRLVSEVVA
jgi:phenylacetate-CoA ligase